MLFNQVFTFSGMFLYGIIMGLLFDIYNKILVQRKKINSVLVDIFDVLWGLFFGLIGFLLLLFLNKGHLRFFVFLAIFSGWLVDYFIVKNIKFKGE
ncbi:MAG: spore cortex biosynthesis protein YabQ [Bacillota bacterium]